MNKKVKWVIGAFYIDLFFNRFFTERMLVGKYVNRNYENEFTLGTPHVANALIIYTDNKFYSPYYGKGDYELVYSLAGKICCAKQ